MLSGCVQLTNKQINLPENYDFEALRRRVLSSFGFAYTASHTTAYQSIATTGTAGFSWYKDVNINLENETPS